MKLFFKIALIVILLIVLTVGCFGFYITRGLKAGENMVINPVNVSQFEDGVYKGSYGKGRWHNEVSVTVKDKKIARIDVNKTVLFEKPDMTKDLINRVVKKQNTTVDVISGATVSSKAYLKSIENALTD